MTMEILYDPFGGIIELAEPRDQDHGRGQDPIPVMDSLQRRRIWLRWIVQEPRNRGALMRMLGVDAHAKEWSRGVLTEDNAERMCEVLERRGVVLRSYHRSSHEQGAATSTKEAGEEQATSLMSLARSWIALELVDGDDEPVSGVRYEIRLPNGVVVTGRTDQLGRGYVSNTPLGQCTIVLPDCDRELWSRA